MTTTEAVQGHCFQDRYHEHLAGRCNGNIEIDANCISDRNAIISAHR